jgi:hypothetical protein
MKPYEPKNRDKTKVKKRGGGGTKDDKKPNQKKRKDNETLCQKSKKGRFFFIKKAIKEKEVVPHKLLASILSYLMLAPW